MEKKDDRFRITVRHDYIRRNTSCCLYFHCHRKIQKSVVALVGAALTMLLGLIPFHGHYDSTAGQYIRSVFDYIEFEVIFLLIGMMILVHIASRSGVFKWMALQILKATKGHPKLVLFALAAFTAVASAF